ncbi:MAG: hypothetical protein HY293_05170 [Planctomycetes bacterium]|nr:hypothetical protein [Planctomycetota bacterium]
MARDLFSPVGILDDIHGAVARVASPWLGVLWLLTMPYRFAQVYFVRELIDLGAKAPDYSLHLEMLAWILFAAFLPAVFGRAIYVRACLLGLQSGTRVGREALRVPGPQMINTLYGALLVEVLFGLTVWMFFMIPLLAAPAGLVYVAALRTDRPGLIRPLVETGRLMLGFKTMLGLMATFLVALPVAYINLYMGLRMGLWAATALGGDGLTRWEHLLRPIRPHFGLIPGETLTILLCTAGAFLVVEPFWLAALTVYAHRTRLRQSGEDLQLRFRLLTGGR